MATSAEIIAAIDTAIADWVGKPITLSQNGRTVTYRSLADLTAARTYYANLVRSQGGTVGFQLTNLKSGGTF